MHIIQLLLTIVYLFACLFIANKIRRSIIVFFVILYSSQLIIAELNIYEIYEISIQTIMFFNANIIFFIFGALYYENLNKLKFRTQITKFSDIEKNINIKSFYKVNRLIIIQLFFLIVAIYYLNKMSDSIYYFEQGESVRSYYFQTGGLFSSYTEMFLYQNITKNYLYISSFIFSYIVLIKTKLNLRDYFLLIISLIFIIIIALTTQGRWDVLPPLLISIFLSFYIRFNSPFTFKKRVYPTFIIFISLFLIGVGVISLMRINVDVNFNNFISTINESVFEPLIAYFSLPIAAFDYGLKFIFNNEGLYFGTATFAGFEELVFTPFQIINKFHDFGLANADLGSLMTPNFNLNPTYYWNALFTGLVNYYLDFGFVGIIIYPFFIGYLFSKIIDSFLKKSDLFYLMLLSVFFTLLFNNMFSSSFQSYSNWILIVSLYLYKKIMTLEFKLKKIN